jgi:hypothetical protein
VVAVFHGIVSSRVVVRRAPMPNSSKPAVSFPVRARVEGRASGRRRGVAVARLIESIAIELDF